MPDDRAQADNYRIARQAIIGCGGRIVGEYVLPDGTHRLRYDGCDGDRLRVVLEAMVPGSIFRRVDRLADLPEGSRDLTTH